MKLEEYEEVCTFCEGKGTIFMTNDICCNCCFCDGIGKIDWINKIKKKELIFSIEHLK